MEKKNVCTLCLTRRKSDPSLPNTMLIQVMASEALSDHPTFERYDKKRKPLLSIDTCHAPFLISVVSMGIAVTSKYNVFSRIRSLHGRPFAGRASNWQSYKLGCWHNVFTYCKVSGFEKKESNHILLGNVLIHYPARLRLSPQMAKPCKERIVQTVAEHLPAFLTLANPTGFCSINSMRYFNTVCVSKSNTCDK